jgi:heme exporter protein C
MGEVQRIFYYHVPSAWTAFLLFFLNFVASIQYLVGRKPGADKITNWIVIAIGAIVCVAAYVVPPPEGVERSAIATTGIAIAGIYFLIRKLFPGERADILAVVTAEVGVVFCTIVLITGPLWARPVWGIWWAPGDIRLTSTLVLWLIYIAYLMLRKFSSSGNTALIAAALAVFGALDVPLVYFSIWFFRTQHPQPVIGGGGSIDPRMMQVLLINWLAFLCFAFLVCWSRYRLEVIKREVEEAQGLQELMETSTR